VTCHYCKGDTSGGDFVHINHPVFGIVRCCDRCLERADLGEPAVEHLTYEEEDTSW
jgi:hypothetical protein